MAPENPTLGPPADWNPEGILGTGKDHSISDVETLLERRTLEFESIKGELAQITKEGVRRALDILAEARELSFRISAYGRLILTLDPLDQNRRRLAAKTREADALFKERTSFFETWWNSLPLESVQDLSPNGVAYQRYLARLQSRRQYSLSADMEMVIKSKNKTGISAIAANYLQIVDNINFRFDLDDGAPQPDFGKNHKPKLAELSTLSSSSNPVIRRAALRSICFGFMGNARVLGNMYRTLAEDWVNEYVVLRHFHSPISSVNLLNEIPDEAVNTFLNVLRKRLGVFNTSFAKKAQLLGMVKLDRYSIYAPMDYKVPKMSFDSAASFAIKSLEEIDVGFGMLASRVFRAGHIHFSPTSRKQTIPNALLVAPSVIPYVVMNFGGGPRDVFLLASELASATHGQLASNNSMLSYHPVRPMKEANAWFAQLLCIRQFMKSTRDSSVRNKVIVQTGMHLFNSLAKQAYLGLFEISAFDAISKGASASELCSLYLSMQRELFGVSMEVPEEIRWEWMASQHIYLSPFQSLVSSLGCALGLSFYSRFTSGQESFRGNYSKALSTGGSMALNDILRTLGLDIESAITWNESFDALDKVLDPQDCERN